MATVTAVSPPTGRDKPVCGGARRGGGTCGRPAGWGTPHPGVGRCKLHGGCTPSHVAAGRRRLAEVELARLGEPPVDGDVDSAQVLLGAVAEARFNTLVLASWVAELDQPTQENFGPGGAVSTGEHVLSELYRYWFDRKVSTAVAALRAGIDQRRIEVQEELAVTFSELVRDLLAAPELGLGQDRQVAGLEVAGRLMRALPVRSAA